MRSPTAPATRSTPRASRRCSATTGATGARRPRRSTGSPSRIRSWSRSATRCAPVSTPSPRAGAGRCAPASASASAGTSCRRRSADDRPPAARACADRRRAAGPGPRLTPPPSPRAEYERRWNALRAACAARGLAGAVVVSRGGAQTDSYADVLYLANHYNVFTLLPDAPPYWSGHSHSALVLGPEGDPVLVEGFGEVRPDLVVVDDVRVAADLPAGIVEVMAEKGMRGERVGRAGAVRGRRRGGARAQAAGRAGAPARVRAGRRGGDARDPAPGGARRLQGVRAGAEAGLPLPRLPLRLVRRLPVRLLALGRRRRRADRGAG